ncbi:MAG: ATP synthase F0 subunit B [Myxococcales bacterium]|nr:ATP synthase F0 subunit B [Myxococcales bacterium]
MMSILSGGHGFDFKVQGFYIIDFLVYAAVLVVVLRKPLTAFVELRREKLVKDIEEARKLREEAERKLADYTKRLSAIESEAQQILADARAQGEAERTRILAEATATAQKLRADAKTRLEQESKKLAHDLELHAVELATQVAERIIVERISENHRKALFSDYVDQVENKGLIADRSSGGLQ